MMKYSVQMSNQDLSNLSKNWRWFLGLGVGLFILGLLAITFATFTTLLSVMLLGALILITGLCVIINAFYFWGGRSGFSYSLFMGILYSLVGLMLIFGPTSGSITITLLLAILFILLGISRIVSSVSIQFPRWKWSLANGIITLALGVMILAEWPASGLFIIGLFIGIDLILFGWTSIMLAMYVKALK